MTSSAKFGQSFSAGAKEQLRSTIDLLKDYKDELYEDGQIARAETVENILHMLGGRN
jgi:hypothetical protein